MDKAIAEALPKIRTRPRIVEYSTAAPLSGEREIPTLPDIGKEDVEILKGELFESGNRITSADIAQRAADVLAVYHHVMTDGEAESVSVPHVMKLRMKSPRRLRPGRASGPR